MKGNRGLRLGCGASALVGILLAGCGTETARRSARYRCGWWRRGGAAGRRRGGGASGAGATGGSGAACAAPTACLGTMSGPWCVEQLPIDGSSQTLSGVWSDRPDDVWVTGGRESSKVGWCRPPTDSCCTSTVCSWSKSPLPSAEPGLNAIWGAGANDIWAVGQHGIAINWDGKYWSNAPGGRIPLSVVGRRRRLDDRRLPLGRVRWTQAPGGFTHDVCAVSPTNAWATAGLTATFQIPDVARWDGHTWTTTRCSTRQ